MIKNLKNQLQKNLARNLFFLFLFSTLSTIFIFKFTPQSKISSPLGEIIFDSSLPSPQKKLLEEHLSPWTKNSNLTITTEVTTIRPSPESNLIFEIEVPIESFSSPLSNISKSDPNLALIPINQLTPQHKLLALDQAYFLDSFDSGAIFHSLHFDGPEKTFAMDKIRTLLPKFPEKTTTLSLIQTGVTALGRRLNTKLAQQNYQAEFFGQHIKPLLSSSDLTHISNELSFFSPCQTPSTSTTLCSDPRMLKLLLDLGIDIVELTGNHNNDYGPSANIQTISQYHQANLRTFGGGKNQTEAQKPLQISQKSNQITLLGYNKSTSTIQNGQIAHQNHPGANLYQEEQVKADIAAAKAKNQLVIVSIQYFECYSYPNPGAEMPSCDQPIAGQAKLFRQLVDFGADIVIGTQAHQPQVFELYHQKPIFYGLGNLFFDQIAWPGTTRSLILTHYFYQNHHLQTKITPTKYDHNFQPQILNPEDQAMILKRLSQPIKQP